MTILSPRLFAPEPRELANADPPLRFSCDIRAWCTITDIVDEFWWEVRYFRASAWDNNLGGVIYASHGMDLRSAQLVAILEPLGVRGEVVRAWLESYRIEIDRDFRAHLDKHEPNIQDTTPYF